MSSLASQKVVFDVYHKSSGSQLTLIGQATMLLTEVVYGTDVIAHSLGTKPSTQTKFINIVPSPSVAASVPSSPEFRSLG